jgi:PAS domain S-box-containing protein
MTRPSETPAGERSAARARSNDWHADEWATQVSAVAIVELDAEGFVRAFNAGAERIKGYRADEVLGRHFSLFYRADDREAGLPDTLLAAALFDGWVEDTGWRVRADGTTFWAHVTITAIRAGAGEHTGYVKIVRDLSHDKRYADQTNAFLRTFAHDLLSPITALTGFLELLQESQERQPELLARAHDASEHLAEMARGLARRVRQGDEPAVRLPVSLAAVAREAAALVLPGDLRDRLRFDVDGDPIVVIDPMALRRAVANVVENAAKYSEQPITIEVSAAGSTAVLLVRDRGRGIHPDDLPRITDDGYRGRLADPGDGGSGLGLASARELVTGLGGTLDVDSAQGVGTTVRIALPLAGSGVGGPLTLP